MRQPISYSVIHSSLIFKARMSDSFFFYVLLIPYIQVRWNESPELPRIVGE